ncbi:MAG: HAD hydrolase-like protein [Patescibacteria group bacterium]|nr:HAD hydrolase-like protein [Patescibacteria group bacterium]
MPKIKQKRQELIALDFDGTLWDSLSLSYHAILETFAYFNIDPPTKDEFRFGITKFGDGFYHRFGIPRSIPLEEIRKIRFKCRQEIYYKGRIFPDVIPTLQEIKKSDAKIIIISGNVFDNIKGIVRSNKELNNLVSAIYTGDKNILIKMAIDRFEIDVSKATYVDDTTEGLSIAKNLGLFTVAVGYEGAFQPPEQLIKVADAIIYSPKELLNKIRLK